LVQAESRCHLAASYVFFVSVMAQLVASAILFISAVVFSCTWISIFDRLMRVEYLALVPNGQGPMKETGPFITDWIKVSYPAEGDFTASDVNMGPLSGDEGKGVIGALRGLDLGESGAMLTGRLHNGNLHVFVNTGLAPIARGCCADTMRIYPGDGSVSRDVIIVNIVRTAVNSIPNRRFLGISHAFHPWEVDGTTFFLLPVIFADTKLGLTIDGIIALNLDTLKILPTAEGDIMFIPWRYAGTLDGSAEGTIFKVQYKASGPPPVQQWHSNCVRTFTTSDGTDVLAIALRMDVEAILFKNPYLHKKADGGGTILQRFGSPKIFNQSGEIIGQHHFGIKVADTLPLIPGNATPTKRAYGGLHNIYYFKHHDGRETLTVFANQYHGGNQSGLFEYDMKLVKDSSGKATDAVFDTNYTFVLLPFASCAQGGARPIGNGVYIAASGLADRGYMAVDTLGNQKLYAYSNKLLYDPFVFVSWTERPRSSLSTALLSVTAIVGLICALHLGRSVGWASARSEEHTDAVFVRF